MRPFNNSSNIGNNYRTTGRDQNSPINTNECSSLNGDGLVDLRTSSNGSSSFKYNNGSPLNNGFNNIANHHQRENWLDNEAQPTDSEMESLYKDRSRMQVGQNERPNSSHTFTTSDCDTEKDKHLSRENGSLVGAILSMSDPLSRDQLLEIINALKDRLKTKYGHQGTPAESNELIIHRESSLDNSNHSSTHHNRKCSIEKMDADLNSVKLKLMRLSMEHEKIKDVLGINKSLKICDEQMMNNNEPRMSFQRSGSTPSSDIGSAASPTAMFVPLENEMDGDRDYDDRLRQRDRLMSRQLQRRENLLQRRIQRVNEKRYIDDERRSQEQWMERTKAEQDFKRSLILQSYQQDKEESSSTKPPFNKQRSRQQLRRSVFSNSNATLSPADMSNFMAPTNSSQKRMNRAASLMSGLNQTSDLRQSISNLTTIQNGNSMHDLLAERNDNLTGSIRRFSMNGGTTRLHDSNASLSNGSRLMSGRLNQSKTNRLYMTNAITNVSLAGHANKKQREAVLMEMESSCARHFMILFRDHRLLYRALYTYVNDATTVEKIHGIGPMTVDESMIEKFFKYNSGNRTFAFIPAKRFSIQCDAFVINDEYWHKRNSIRR